MARQFLRIASLFGLLLMVNPAAWAGRGDVDPNYGERGQLDPFGTVLSLPDGRLLIDATDSEGTFKVRLVDTDGRDVQTFGDAGYASISVPAATPWFRPIAATLGSGGKMYIEGLLWASEEAGFVEAILLLDAAGRPELSFGGQGDGLLRMTDLPTSSAPNLNASLAAFTVDPAGRIVVAQHGWTSENDCGGPMALRRFLITGEPDPAFGVAGSVEVPDIDFCAGAPLFAARDDGGIVAGDGRTIIAFDPSGSIDAGFGAGGRVYPSESAWTAGFLLPDNSLLVYYSIHQPTNVEDAIIAKFDKNGLVDTDFGSGTGLVRLQDVLAYAEVGGIRGFIDRLILAPASAHLYARITMRRADASRFCVGIARYSLDGTFDGNFGRNGLTCLDYGYLNFTLLSVQSDGAPLFQLDTSNILRLMPDDMPSPGIITGVGDSHATFVDESAGKVYHNLVRVAGRDGAVSADYAALHGFSCSDPRRCIDYASAGADYVATSGRLDWAGGEDGKRSATVTIVNDRASEGSEGFTLATSHVEGGALFFGDSTLVVIGDDDDGSKVNSGDSGSGGGGSISWATILTLLMLLTVRRRVPQAG